MVDLDGSLVCVLIRCHVEVSDPVELSGGVEPMRAITETIQGHLGPDQSFPSLS